VLRSRLKYFVLPVTAVVAVACASASNTTAPKASRSQAAAAEDPAHGLKVISAPAQEGVEHLKFKYGPIKIQPGQNNIVVSGTDVPKPKVDGYIVAIHPNLVRNDGSVPPVDVIHLHHGVWVNLGRGGDLFSNLFFASGEEKTQMILPKGYGYTYKASEPWLINYMLHNLLSTPDEVSIVYDMDFIPASSPGAAKITPAHPIWMDVQKGHIYPVFDVLKGSGTNGTFTYPDQADHPYRRRQLNQWTADSDTVLIATAGHLHPGGLHVDLWDTRAGAKATAAAKPSVNGDKAHIFRSDAIYYEPAGAVSWDVTMTATPPDWRVAVKKGDTISISVTYDSARASWYESMGIAVMWGIDGTAGTDPFTTRVDAANPVITHGHLPENDNHGGKPAPTQYTDVSKLPSGPVTDKVTIADFTYAPGDIGGIYSQVPVVKAGQTLKFFNEDAPRGNGIWHTITSCKAPCDRSTGVAYPLADGNVQFDSGELGQAGAPTAGRLDWTVPSNLPTGTYTYFCRIHPSMRGAFRVAA
jgi:plastocyanin